jgi:hypothetical protein
MALFNYATKEITIKIVYYGPGLSGKTTNLQYLHSIFDANKRGKLLSLATEADRTLFFDFLPVELGKIRDFSIRFQLYTVPGQVRYNATRKLVLKGADAIVFVADSQREMREQNTESIKNMRENLLANNINPEEIPIMIQYNKRDLPNILSLDELNKELNEDRKYEYKPAVAINGTGVEDTFQQITRLVIQGIKAKHKLEMQPPAEHAGTVSPVEDIPAKPPVTEKPPAPAQVFPEEQVYEPSGYDLSEIEQTRHQVPETVRESTLQGTQEDRATFPREVIIREIKDGAGVPPEKLDAIVKGITEMTEALKQLQNTASGIHTEISAIRKEQKELSGLLRQMLKAFETLETKKSWFRFS